MEKVDPAENLIYHEGPGIEDIQAAAEQVRKKLFPETIKELNDALLALEAELDLSKKPSDIIPEELKIKLQDNLKTIKSIETQDKTYLPSESREYTAEKIAQLRQKYEVVIQSLNQGSNHNDEIVEVDISRAA